MDMKNFGSEMLQKRIVQIREGFPDVISLHNIQILSRNGKYSISLHCTVDVSLTVGRAHEIATGIEDKIRTFDERIEPGGCALRTRDLILNCFLNK